MKTKKQTRIRRSLQLNPAVVLFLSFFASLMVGSVAADVPPSFKTDIQPDLLAQVEKELIRLKAQAEQEPGPDRPPPSRRVAYLLLAGLAAQGSVIERLSESEQQIFATENTGTAQAKLFTVHPNARIALVDRWIHDKAGSYLLRRATLYLRHDGEWTSKGSGTAVVKQ